MIYTVSLLTTVPDCEALIELAEKEKETLTYRKQGLQRQRKSATSTSQEIEADLAAIIAELKGLHLGYDSLPEGPAKKEAFSNIKKKEHKKFLLEERKENYGVLALLEKEFDIASIDRSIAETDDFIVQVTERMEEIV